MNAPRNLISELKTNIQVLKKEIDEKNITQSRLRRDTWDSLSKSRYHDEIRWFLIDREMNLRENLESLYKQISNHNAAIHGLLYLGDSRTKTDFKNLNKERAKLLKDTDKICKKLKTLLLS